MRAKNTTMDKDFVKAVADFCKQEDIVLMIDEVQTGNGRTGELYAAEALNEFLYEKSFRDLLLCLSSYKKAAIAERIYSRILNGTANQDALVNALNSIIENNDLSEDFVDALKTCIVLHSNRKDIRLSTFDSVFSPVDIYEVYANRSLTELINTIAGDAPFSAKELAENAGINLPPIDAEGHYW